MFYRKLCLAAAAIITCCATTHAQGLIKKLPDDGSWAKYRGLFTNEEFGGLITQVPVTVTVKSVGETDDEVETMDRLRWFEVETTMEKEAKILLKFSVPKKDIEAGNDLFPSIRTIWLSHSKLEDGKPTKINSDSPWAQIISIMNPRSGVKLNKIADQELESVIGSHLCQGVSWETVNEETPSTKYQHLVKQYSHKSSPAWPIEIIVETLPFRDGRNTSKTITAFVLEQTGKDAQSALPDNN